MEIERTDVISNLSTKNNKPYFDLSDVSPYAAPIARKVVEGICNVSTNTLVKHEMSGFITPLKVKNGSRDLIFYSPEDVLKIMRSKGVSFKKGKDAEVVMIWSQKGGTGKSSYSQHLSSFLSLIGGKVLVIDLDPQADVSSLLRGFKESKDIILNEDELDPTLAEIMDWTLKDGSDSGYRRLQDKEVIKELTPNLHLIPSGLDLGEINFSLNRLEFSDRFFADGSRKQPPELYMIKDVIDRLKPQYDFIIFDCGPNIETCNISAMLAANRILIPLEVESKTMLIIKRNHEILNKIRRLNPNFKFDKILISPNKHRVGEVIKTKALWALQEAYKDSNDIQLSDIVIPSSVIIDKCAESREPVYHMAGKFGKEAKATAQSAREFTNYFFAMIHELFDVPLDHLVFSQPQELEV